MLPDHTTDQLPVSRPVRLAFPETARAIRGHQQTVTRRLNPPVLKAGDMVEAVQSEWMLTFTGAVTPLATLRVVSLREECLSLLMDDPAYGADELRLEGGPANTVGNWVLGLLIRYKTLSPNTPITRIEFEYV